MRIRNFERSDWEAVECFEWWCDSFGAGKVQKGRARYLSLSLAARKQIYANALKIPARTKRLSVRVYKLKCTLEGARRTFTDELYADKLPDLPKC